MQESLVIGFKYIFGMFIFIYQGRDPSFQVRCKLKYHVFRGLSILSVTGLLRDNSRLHIEDVVKDLLGFLLLEGNVGIRVEPEDLWLLGGR